MYSKLIISVALVSSALAIACCNGQQTSEELKMNLDSSSRDLDAEFGATMKQLFWDKQKLSEDLMSGDKETAFAIRKLSNLISTVQLTQYALRRNSLDVVRDILTTKPSTSMFGAILEARTTLRAMIAGFQHTSSPWQLLHLLLKHYVGKSASPSEELKKMAAEAYQARAKFGRVSSEVSKTMKQAYRAYSETSSKPKEFKNILNELDSLIDYASGCADACSKLPKPDWETFFAKPMIADERQVAELIERYVPADLLKALRVSELSTKGQILAVKPEQILAVSEEDVDDFHEEFMSREGLLELASGDDYEDEDDDE